MKNVHLAILLAAIFAVTAANSAWAGPSNGWSVFVGRAEHKVTDSSGVLQDYSSDGGSIGFDYQRVFLTSWSFNLLVMSTKEDFEDDQIPGGKIETGGHGLIAFQIRKWFGDFFLGGHIGNYNEHLRTPEGEIKSEEEITQFNGFGLAAGYKLGDSGFYVVGQIDSAETTLVKDTGQDPNIATVELTGFRIHIGHRW